MFGIKTYILGEAGKASVWLQFCAGRAYQALKQMPPGDKNILFTLADERPDEEIPRHYYLMLSFFAQTGYRVYIYRKPTFQFFKRLGTMGGRHLYSSKNVKFISALPERTEDIIYAFDHEDPDEAMLARKWKRLVYVNSLKPASWKAGREFVCMPYPMSPFVYRSGASRRLDGFRKSPRRIRALFFGNTKKEYYNNPVLKKYSQLTRLEALNALRSSGRKVVDTPARSEFERLLGGNGYHVECVLSDYSKFKIERGEWLATLSKSDFFLCLSGTDYPMCHNCIETLAVGTIPILSYTDWFDPPLEHRKNALVYSGADDFLKKVEEAMGMGEAEIEKLRKNAIQYYEDHLSPEAFVRRFESHPDANTLILMPRVLCTDPYSDGRSRLERLGARMASHEKDVTRER